MDAMKKGRIAEKIVKDMFKEAGFKVVNYGYEYTVPELCDRKNLIKGKAAEYIRHQPDFIVVNSRNEAFFVEVKFRSNYIKPEKDIFPYPNCYVLLLTQDYILAQSTKYLFQKNVKFLPITKMPPFSRIPYKIIDKYVQKLRRKLGKDTLASQVIGKAIKKFTKLDVIRKPTKFKVHMPRKRRKR